MGINSRWEVPESERRRRADEGTNPYSNFKWLLDKHIYEKKYKGALGMEHGNSKPVKSGELAVIDAYITVDSF